MVKNTIALLLLVCSVKLTAQAQLKFTNAKQNFGFVKKGEQVKLTYQFTNTGNQPLLITETKVECSCTKVSFSKEPVLPGKTANIEVVFDTSPTYDRQDRTVEVFSNGTGSPQKIRFKGVVKN